MLIKSDSEKVFGFFMNSNLDFKGQKYIKTGKQLAFYWINGIDELITCISKSEEPKIISDEHNFIHIEWRTAISNNRRREDFAGLYSEYWEGMRTGHDCYP